MTESASWAIASNLLTIAKWSVILVSCCFLLSFITFAFLKAVNYTRKYKRKLVYLEVTPSAHQDKKPFSTTQLMSVIHGLLETRSTIDTLVKYTPSISLEILSTKELGIRYLLSTDESVATVVEQMVQSYDIDAKIRRTGKRPAYDGYCSYNVYRQKKHFAFPIDSCVLLEDHDAASYLTNSMTKLSDKEMMSLQIVITPARIKEAERISSNIRKGYWSGSSLQKYYSPQRVLEITKVIAKLPLQIAWLITYNFFTNNSPPPSSQTKKYHSGHPSPAEQQVINIMHNKVSQDLFYADIRSCVMSENKVTSRKRSKELANALSTFSTPQGQSLRSRVINSRKVFSIFIAKGFDKRLPAFLHRNSNILSSEEIGSIFHFPNSKSARTDNVIKSLSKTLPAPVSLKGSSKLDVLIGENIHQGLVTQIGLTKADREKHLFVVGGTGNGKTTMLLYSIVQDMRNGKSVAVIDPHGDLAESLLSYIPESRLKDLIYFNPDDIDYPISMNLLELPKGLNKKELEREKDRLTESLISVLRKIFSSDDTGGHRVEYILRNSIQTALLIKDPTIFTVFELLTNDNFRNKVVSRLPEGSLKNFWLNEMAKAGSMQRVKMSHGVTSKIGRFEFSPSTKRVLGQSKSTINFDEILSSNKILICNFSKGNLGEDTSSLFGTAVLAKLQLSALRRSRFKHNERKPFYLYVDEFQNFATMPFVQMLSEARKYKMYLTMAEQSTSQQEERRLVQIILANVGSVISFRTGSQDDEKLILPLFKPYVGSGDLNNLPTFSFYAKLSALEPQEPMSGRTVVIEEPVNDNFVKRAISTSRSLYAYDSS